MERRTTDRLLRARAQAIGGGVREDSVAAVLDRVLAVQAQDLPAAELGLRVRARGLTLDAVRRATDTERTAVRGWFMRGTLQLVPAADARWLLALFGPVYLALAARRLRELGLDQSLCERSERLIADAVGGEGPLTRAQLTDRLTTLGVEPKGQSAFHLIRRAALAGRICHGPQRGGEATFVLLDDWLPAGGPPPFTGAAAERELARRYRLAHGPSDALDFIHWSGLRTTPGKEAWAAVRESGDTDTATPPDPAAPDVRLLPAYDNYLVGYRSRDLSVPARDERRVWPGGGQIRATVLVDGLAVGTWSRGRGGAGVNVEPFPSAAPPTAAVTAALARESADIARFSSGTHSLSTKGL
ncbi:winged helix DNA-binding domain-containing protein [Streptomyces antarcticus]|uniref:winged helix DNA-binding domain-containing protein n=1 Tax=Streptomyces antarcticus TaxID=2996458 RepID=UPI00226E7155|nr:MULTISPECIES: winged helix DNA-binding domain-containing protein [unclassified Streptomyces]MCY0941751.1 winged helix DNA-binding domain-containing protein [Streptomyces sp. H34-AA3]MCZ4081539.1 winged helix DNA-binding domain-containing protein [Streptomyces sp. H34-S5]